MIRIKQGCWLLLILFPITIFSMGAPPGFYSTASLGTTSAPRDRLSTDFVDYTPALYFPQDHVGNTKDRYLENRSEALAETLSDGYQLNRYFGLELGVGHVGVVSYDNFFLVARGTYPFLTSWQAYAKGGLVYAGASYPPIQYEDDNPIYRSPRAGMVWGAGLEYFVTPQLSAHVDVASYSIRNLTTQYLGSALYDLGPLRTFSFGIHQYVGHCDLHCRSAAGLPWHKGTYVGASYEGLTAYRGHLKNYSQGYLFELINYRTFHPISYRDHGWGFGIRHGYQLNSHFSVELQILHSAVVSEYSYKQINFYTVDSRVSLPLAGNGPIEGWSSWQAIHRLRPYAKVGMAYTQESYYLMNIGVGAEFFMNNQVVLNFSWQRLNEYANSHYDFLDQKSYYSVAGIGMTYYFYTH